MQSVNFPRATGDKLGASEAGIQQFGPSLFVSKHFNSTEILCSEENGYHALELQEMVKRGQLQQCTSQCVIIHA